MRCFLYLECDGKKKGRKSSYFDFLQIIHKENSLSIFDNERQRARAKGRDQGSWVNESFFFSSTVWRALSTKFRIEWQKVYRSGKGKKKCFSHQKRKIIFHAEAYYTPFIHFHPVSEANMMEDSLSDDGREGGEVACAHQGAGNRDCRAFEWLLSSTELIYNGLSCGWI